MDRELLPFVQPLTEEETRRFLEKLWQLLAYQTERYTMGDSTSAPTETAQELLASICYTLQFEMARSGITPHELLNKDLYAVLKNGQAHLADKVAEAKRLWEVACSKGQADADTLRWIVCFFRKYDLYFFAHRTPCDMGYPLPPCASEQLKGISYVEACLKNIMERKMEITYPQQG